MKASKAASASFLVSAIQISCSARLALGCWLFGSLLRTLAVLCTQQPDQRLLEVAARDALEVEDRDQHLQARRPARVGRQNCRRKADALGTFAAAVTHARAAHSDRTNAGLGQMPVAHQPPAAIIGELVGMAAEQA